MVNLNTYLDNPCKTLSIPYWKNKNITLPENMKIVHHSNFNDEYLLKYFDSTFFRLSHSLMEIKPFILDGYEIYTAGLDDIENIVTIINDSYDDITVTNEQIKSYTNTCVYNKNLWIIVKEMQNYTNVGCGIADFDKEAQEGILEWIQVIPSYRGLKIGQAIVNELLLRLKNIAKFVTVSGQIDNQTNPEKLYRKCGFTGDDIWHILKLKQ